MIALEYNYQNNYLPIILNFQYVRYRIGSCRTFIINAQSEHSVSILASAINDYRYHVLCLE